MTRFPSLAVTALVASLVAIPALAGGSDVSLQSALDLGNYNVDVSTLSEAQKAQITAEMHSSDSAGDQRAFINSIIN